MNNTFRELVALPENFNKKPRYLSLTVQHTEGETFQEVRDRSIERPNGAVSDFYRSSAIHVFNFYKPISRVVKV